MFCEQHFIHLKMSEYINQITKNSDFNTKIQTDYIYFKNLSKINKLEASDKIYIKYRKLENAANIMAETIIDLVDEKEVLKSEIISYGIYDEAKINEKIKEVKMSSSVENNSKKLLNQLQLTINKSKIING